MLEIIQALVLFSYNTESDITPLKHRGIFNFPITKSFHLSIPIMFVVIRTLILSLDIYHFSLLCIELYSLPKKCIYKP